MFTFAPSPVVTASPPTNVNVSGSLSPSGNYYGGYNNNNNGNTSPSPSPVPQSSQPSSSSSTASLSPSQTSNNSSSISPPPAVLVNSSTGNGNSNGTSPNGSPNQGMNNNNSNGNGMQWGQNGQTSPSSSPNPGPSNNNNINNNMNNNDSSNNNNQQNFNGLNFGQFDASGLASLIQSSSQHHMNGMGNHNNNHHHHGNGNSNLNTNSNNTVGVSVCWDWIGGRCDRGTSCKFLHQAPDGFSFHNLNGNGNQNGNQNGNLNISNGMQMSRGNGMKNSFPGSDSVCHQFQKMGRCQFGENCKFAHIPPMNNMNGHHGGHHQNNNIGNGNGNGNGGHWNGNQMNGMPKMSNYNSIVSTASTQSSQFDLQSISSQSSGLNSPYPVGNVLNIPMANNSSLNLHNLPSTINGQEVCRFYAKTGRCKYGHACKFIHINGPGLGQDNLHHHNFSQNGMGNGNQFNSFGGNRNNGNGNISPNLVAQLLGSLTNGSLNPAALTALAAALQSSSSSSQQVGNGGKPADSNGNVNANAIGNNNGRPNSATGSYGNNNGINSNGNGNGDFNFGSFDRNAVATLMNHLSNAQANGNANGNANASALMNGGNVGNNSNGAAAISSNPNASASSSAPRRSNDFSYPEEDADVDDLLQLKGDQLDALPSLNSYIQLANSNKRNGNGNDANDAIAALGLQAQLAALSIDRNQHGVSTNGDVNAIITAANTSSSPSLPAASTMTINDTITAALLQLQSNPSSVCLHCGSSPCVFNRGYGTLCWKCSPCTHCGNHEGKAVCALGLCDGCYVAQAGDRIR